MRVEASQLEVIRKTFYERAAEQVTGSEYPTQLYSREALQDLAGPEWMM